ncbi:MAG: 30S ribosomal protein S1 [Cyanobacteria bacterium SZAS LIN-2]|nr:30S ribosomal protein S1 [Cyanobacteria bacterium SZAS LIN-3]MBS1997669.1 30S ribosomal protein S1 [Cyanobacteria bacterium SZAS LIN-2]
MNTGNNNNGSNNNNQGLFLASPFAGLSIDNGNITLAQSEATATKAEKPTPVATAAPAVKTVVRRPQALPRHRSIIAPTATVQVATAPVTEKASVEAAPVVALSPWEQLQQHMQRNTTVRGTVTRVIRNREGAGIVGVKVRVCGLDAFAPYRMLGLSPLDTEHSVTLEKGFRVVEMVKGEGAVKDRIILNHSLVRTQEKTANLISRSKVGDTIYGVIRTIKQFGAFIDIEGASALVHINDLPGGNLRSVKVGQAVTATVVEVDARNNRLGASIRHHFVAGLAVGTEFTGTIKNVERFGAFVELGGIVDGLVHVSRYGKFNPEAGDNVTVKVLEVDNVRGKVQLALLSVNGKQAS